MRNKAKDFPYPNDNKFKGESIDKAQYASKRADGTTNTHPQERMRASGKKEGNTY